MSDNLPVYERLKSFLKGKLEAEEKLEVEAQLSEPDVKNWLRVIGALEAAGDEQYRQQFQNLYQEMQRQKQRKRYVFLAVTAAAVFALLLLLRSDYSPFTSKHPDALFEEFYHPEVPRIRGDSSVSALIGENYQAIVADLAGKSSLTPLEAYALGISYLEMESYDLAISNFKRIDSGSFLLPAAQWYQALGQLKLGEVDSTRYYLNQIQDQFPNSKEQKSAQHLLKELGML